MNLQTSLIPTETQNDDVSRAARKRYEARKAKMEVKCRPYFDEGGGLNYPHGRPWEEAAVREAINETLQEVWRSMSESFDTDTPLSGHGRAALAEYREALKDARESMASRWPGWDSVLPDLTANLLHLIVFGKTATNSLQALEEAKAILGDIAGSTTWLSKKDGRELEKYHQGLGVMTELLDKSQTWLSIDSLNPTQKQLAERLIRGKVFDERLDGEARRGVIHTVDTHRQWLERRNCYDLDWMLGIATICAPVAPDGPSLTPQVRDESCQWSCARPPSEWALIFDMSLDTLKRRIKANTVEITKVSMQSWRVRLSDVPRWYSDKLARYTKDAVARRGQQ